MFPPLELKLVVALFDAAASAVVVEATIPFATSYAANELPA
jgi:hypothetical protein